MNKKLMCINMLVLILGIAAILSCTFFGKCCDATLELAAGGAVPMKCFFCSRTAIFMGIVLIAAAVDNLLLKRKNYLLFIAIGILIILLPNATFGIGVCMAEGMRCATMALLLKIVGAVTIVCGLLPIFVKGDMDV